MDEEELEQPKQKINLGSFFEKVDSIEKVSNRALSRSSANFSIINNQKLIINSINVSIEALETKIRDIANYIIIEKKLEKDVEEDRLLEAQDKEQKEAMVQRATSMMGQPVQEDGAPPEQQKGGSLLGTLLKLGIAAFAIKFLWPVLLPLAGGLLKGALAKLAVISIGGIGALIKALVVGTGLTGIAFGIGKLFENFGDAAENKSNKVAEKVGKVIKDFKFGKNGEVDGPNKIDVSGEIGKDVEKENVVNGEESMRKTLTEKELMVTPGTRIDEEGAEGGGEPSSGDLSMFDEEENKFNVIEGEQDITAEQLEREIAAHETKIEKMEAEGKNEEMIELERDKMEIKKQTLLDMKSGLPVDAKTKYKIIESVKDDEKDLSMSDSSSDVSNLEIEALNQRVDGIVASITDENNKEQNSNLLVPQNTGRVSDASLKVAQADIPFIKVVKNNQLSTSPKSNGLPPEIAAMIS